MWAQTVLRPRGWWANKPSRESQADQFANFWVETPQNSANSPHFEPKCVFCFNIRHHISLSNFRRRIQRNILRFNQARSSSLSYNHPRGHPRWHRTCRVINCKICAYGSILCLLVPAEIQLALRTDLIVYFNFFSPSGIGTMDIALRPSKSK